MGAVRRALTNRLDGWYVLIGVAITFSWVVEDDNTRRLLYPLVPLIAMHALDAVLAACRRLGDRIAEPIAQLHVAALVCRRIRQVHDRAQLAIEADPARRSERPVRLRQLIGVPLEE